MGEKKVIPGSEYNWLKEESENWHESGIISADQRESILSGYAPDPRQQQNKLITVLAVLGSILVGLGVILFFASNWQAIPVAGKLMLIFTVLVAAYGIGYYIGFEKKTYPIVGRAIIFLGSIFFGAAIFLIAQIYHISAHYPNAFLFWAIGIFPIAYLLRTKPVLFLSVILLIVWFGLETYSWIYPLDEYNMAHLYFPLIFLLLGITLYLSGWLHRQYEYFSSFGGIYQGFGVLTGLSMLYYLSFREAFNIPSETKNQAIQYIGMISYEYIAAYIVLLVSSSVLLYKKARSQQGETRYETFVILFLFALGISIFFFPVTDAHWFIPIILNIILAAVIVGVIAFGYLNRMVFMINIGLVFFVLDVLTRYFDFFWQLLDRSVFFIIGGIMLIAGSIMLEKTRRRMIAEIQKGKSGKSDEQ